jgi:hypothetical protein
MPRSRNFWHDALRGHSHIRVAKHIWIRATKPSGGALRDLWGQFDNLSKPDLKSDGAAEAGGVI